MAVTKNLSVGYGANYAHYDYMVDPSLLSPRVNASYMVGEHWRVRGLGVARVVSAPGAEEFLPPTRAA